MKKSSGVWWHLFLCGVLSLLLLSGCNRNVGFKLIRNQFRKVDEMKALRPSEKQVLEANNRLLWTDKQTNVITETTLMGGGLVRLLFSEKKDRKRSKMPVKYLAVESGITIFEGREDVDSLMTSVPFPIFVHDSGSQFTLTAKNLKTETLWSKDFAGVYKCAQIDLARGEAIFVLKNNRDFSVFSILLENGVILWSAMLDQVPAGSKVQNCELFIGDEHIYASLNGTVTSISRAEEEILWSYTLNPDEAKARTFRQSWLQEGTGVIMGAGNTVCSFSAEKGLVWSRKVNMEKADIDSLSLTRYGLLAGFRSDNSALFAMLNKETGDVIWEKKYTDKKDFVTGRQPIPPSGAVLTEDTLTFSAISKIFSSNLEDGEEIYSLDLEWETYADYLYIQKQGDNIILAGIHGIEARDVKTGQQVWEHHGFDTLYESRLRFQAVASGMIGAAYAGAASLNTGGGRNYGGYRTANDLGYNESMAYRMSQSSTKNLRAAAEEGLSYFRKSLDAGSKYKIYNRPVNYESPPQSMAVIINLDTGKLQEIYMMDGSFNCNPEAVIDLSAYRIVETYKQWAYFCKNGDKIDILNLYDSDIPK